MSAGVTDDWSGLGAGQPSWTFGDGGTGAGASVSHAFAAPGTFTVTIGARDALGNAAAAVDAPDRGVERQGSTTTASAGQWRPDDDRLGEAQGDVEGKPSGRQRVRLGNGRREHDADPLDPPAWRQEDGREEHVQGEGRKVDALGDAASLACAGPLRRVRHRQRGQDLAEVVHDRRAEDGHRQARTTRRAHGVDPRPRRSAAPASCGLTSSSGRCRRRARRSRPSGSSRTAASSRPTRARARPSSRRRSRISRASRCPPDAGAA